MITDRTIHKGTAVDEAKLYGMETEKAVSNFNISNEFMPNEFLYALAIYKSACASANSELGLLARDKASAIQKACIEIEKGFHASQFPVDIYQTGSGTSTNMNANEVISSLVALRSGQSINVHPNDEVNKGQSSNDVIPSCIHISAAIALSKDLLPALKHLADSLDRKASKYTDVIKTGRTHLMDAMPISVAQELGGWSAQLRKTYHQVENQIPEMLQLACGGTAVGTGVNTHPDFAKKVTAKLQEKTGLKFVPADNYFCAIGSQDSAVGVSGQLKTAAVSLNKIANDIRWLASGPLNGLNELRLPELQKGSSIMPGKVNPVIPEAVIMACAKVMGNDTTITIAGQAGNFQLNTMLPLIAHTLLDSIKLLSNSCLSLADKVVEDMQVNQAQIERNVHRNPILATALNEAIGYDKATEIAKRAYLENKTVLEVAKTMTSIDESELKKLLDPKNLI